jgi:hypothetical protein
MGRVTRITSPAATRKSPCLAAEMKCTFTAISSFPNGMAKGLMQEGENHAAMDNAVDIAVLFFQQHPRISARMS